jgi:hypothetical protein
MATVTQQATQSTSTNGNSYAFGTTAPANESLLVVFAHVSDTGAAGSISDDKGGTWHQVATAINRTSADKSYCYVREQLTDGTAIVVTVSVVGDNGTGCIGHMFSVTGVTRVGADVVRQSAKQENQGAGTPAPAFASAALTENAVLGHIGNSTSPAGLTPPSGWTESASPSGDSGYSTPTTGAESCFRNSGFTGTTVTWASTSATAFSSMVVELDTSAAAIDLVIDDGAHAHAADNLTLTEDAPAIDLVIQDGALGHGSGPMDLTQDHVLEVGAGAHDHTADNVVLGAGAGEHNLAIQDGAHDHNSGPDMALSQVHVLATQDGAHGHTAENVALGQVHVLGIEAGSHLHSAQNVALGVSGALGVEDGQHGHTADNVALTQVHILSVAGALHGHAADNLVLGEVGAPTLSVADGVHAHVAGELTLAQAHALVVASGVHAHAAANVTLAEGNVALPVVGALASLGGGGSGADLGSGSNEAELAVGATST